MSIPQNLKRKPDGQLTALHKKTKQEKKECQSLKSLLDAELVKVIEQDPQQLDELVKCTPSDVIVATVVTLLKNATRRLNMQTQMLETHVAQLGQVLVTLGYHMDFEDSISDETVAVVQRVHDDMKIALKQKL
jgi:hypothetical protein